MIKYFKVTGPDGKILVFLDSTLAEKQDVTPEQVEALKLSHQLKWLIFEAAKHDIVRASPLS